MLPDRAGAEQLLSEAEVLNPGAWVAHSRHVALAAERIAECHSALDADRAYILGLLHDIGRRTGPNRDRHILDGHDYLTELGHPDAARIALTHSFIVPDIATLQGDWDGTPAELKRLAALLGAAHMNDEDRLLQLCDTVALADGFCTVQERVVDVALRYNVNECTTTKWRAMLALKADFDRSCDLNIYRLLPGLTERILR